MIRKFYNFIIQLNNKIFVWPSQRFREPGGTAIYIRGLLLLGWVPLIGILRYSPRVFTHFCCHKNNNHSFAMLVSGKNSVLYKKRIPTSRTGTSRSASTYTTTTTTPLFCCRSSVNRRVQYVVNCHAAKKNT